MAKLLICDPVDATAIERIQKLGVDVDIRDTITAEELPEVIGAYEGMIVRSRTKVRAPVIDKADNLQIIMRAGVGLDNIDVGYARDHGIDVRNTAAASSNAVAELALGLMFGLARHISRADASMKVGRWDKKQLKGTELAGKTLGIIGYGRIGQLVGEKAQALGMTVVAYDPYVEDENIVSMDELLAQSDYVTLHLPHTKETHHLLSTEEFAKMKEGVYVIDAARGGVVDEAALYEALDRGHLAGAALDVYSEEPPKGKLLRQLVERADVIATPHIGAATKESQARIGDELVKLANHYLT